MSRLIVKNLPKSITTDKLRDIFSEKGLVTDVQLKYTKDGIFRHFGFVGFKTEEAAKVAAEYFNNTCIKASKITVELCASLGDANKPKAWSKYAYDSSAYKKEHGEINKKKNEENEKKPKQKKNNKVQEILDKHKDDPLFLEFMESHAIGKKTLCSNDITLNSEEFVHTSGTQEEEEEESVNKKTSVSDSDNESNKFSESENEEAQDQKDNIAKEKISDFEYLKLKTVKKKTKDEEIEIEKKVEIKRNKKNAIKEEEGTETQVKVEEESETKNKKLNVKKNKKNVVKEEEEEGSTTDFEVKKNKKKLVKEEEESETEVEVKNNKRNLIKREEEQEIDEEILDKEKKHKVKIKSQKIFRHYFIVKVKGLRHPKIKDVKHFFGKLKPRSVRITKRGTAYVSFKTEKKMKEALIRNRSFVGGRRVSVIKAEENEEVCTTDAKNNKWRAQEESLQNEETIAESGRIFVRNLAYTITEEDIEQLFNKYGPVTEVIMPFDECTRKKKGYAIITYLIPEHAAKAYMELDGSIFHGRMLHLLPGKSKLSIEELMEQEGLNYKHKQNLKKKAEAASSHNWNTLFLGQNAVADLMAETYNTTKDKVLDSSGKESVAVRLALGETQIVSQMREFLEESGVHLDAFNQASKERSKTIILAKNLPAKTSVVEIREMFAKYGELGRIVLPPTGVTAIIEFLEPAEAKAAFRRLAYTRFKTLPLYLEWAPMNAFTSLPEKAQDRSLNISEEKDILKKENEVMDIKKSNEEESSDDEDEPPEPETTLYIKNLNFITEIEDIQNHFKKCGKIHEVTLSKKRDPKNLTKTLSMGYGFIQFKKKADAEKALKTLQNSVLQEHALELKRSNRTSQTEVRTSRKSTTVGKQTGTKILVRNIPFQANAQEVTDLFRTFGELKGVRLPKKLVGTGLHRGFAFIDYYTKHDAKRAFKALCQSTHLYGRKMVLEWADEDETIEDIRKRTAENFGEGPSNKTFKKSVATVHHNTAEESD